MVEKQLEPFPCFTTRFYGYYDTSTVGLYVELYEQEASDRQRGAANGFTNELSYF
jgi:hypothetical protein